MKALSIKQPFAELILSGRKTIELRRWNTNFCGSFFIHNSKLPGAKSMGQFGFSELPCRFIHGKANLVSVKKYFSDEKFLKDRRKHLADKSWGDHGFVLGNVKRIKPIPAKGKLNFWEFD